jgi:hypothetical protein
VRRPVRPYPPRAWAPRQSLACLLLSPATATELSPSPTLLCLSPSVSALRRAVFSLSASSSSRPLHQRAASRAKSDVAPCYRPQLTAKRRPRASRGRPPSTSSSMHADRPPPSAFTPPPPRSPLRPPPEYRGASRPQTRRPLPPLRPIDAESPPLNRAPVETALR